MFLLQTSNLIKKYIQPLMEEYGFALSFNDKKHVVLKKIVQIYLAISVNKLLHLMF